MKIQNYFLSCFLFILPLTSYSLQVTTAKATQSQLERTMKGETILKEVKIPKDKKEGKMFTALTMMDASVDEIYRLISNFKEYPHFMPDMERIVMLEDHPNSAKVTFILGLPLGISKKYRIQAEFKNNHGKTAYLKWKKFPWKGLKSSETIRDTEGYWYLSPHPLDKEKTLVKYRVYSDPGDVPFGFGWLVDYMTKKSLPAVFKNTKEKLKKDKAH